MFVTELEEEITMPKQTFLNLTPAKQRNIVYAALAEFGSKGYVLANVGDIAKKASVSKGSMYQYFEDKKEFYLYLTDYVYSLLKTTIKMQLQTHMQSSQSVEKTMEELRDAFWNVIDSYQMEICFMFSTLREQEPDICSALQQYHDSYKTQLIEPLIQNFVEMGKIRADIPVQFISLYCEAIIVLLKNQLKKTVVFIDDTNQLVITMTKDEWDQTFEAVEKIVLSGLQK